MFKILCHDVTLTECHACSSRISQLARTSRITDGGHPQIWQDELSATFKNLKTFDTIWCANPDGGYFYAKY